MSRAAPNERSVTRLAAARNASGPYSVARVASVITAVRSARSYSASCTRVPSMLTSSGSVTSNSAGTTSAASGERRAAWAAAAWRAVFDAPNRATVCHVVRRSVAFTSSAAMQSASERAGGVPRRCAPASVRNNASSGETTMLSAGCEPSSVYWTQPGRNASSAGIAPAASGASASVASTG